jgi:hypothetical protein
LPRMVEAMRGIFEGRFTARTGFLSQTEWNLARQKGCLTRVYSICCP